MSLTDVSNADPFAEADQTDASSDAGDGVHAAAKQYEYPGAGKIVGEF